MVKAVYKYVLIGLSILVAAANDFGYRVGVAYSQTMNTTFVLESSKWHNSFHEGFSGIRKTRMPHRKLFEGDDLIEVIDNVEASDQSVGFLGGVYYTTDSDSDDIEICSNYEAQVLANTKDFSSYSIINSFGVGFLTESKKNLMLNIGHKHNIGQSVKDRYMVGMNLYIPVTIGAWHASIKVGGDYIMNGSVKQKKLIREIRTRKRIYESQQQEFLDALAATNKSLLSIALIVDQSLSSEEA